MSREYTDHICDLLSPLGPVIAKAMFGGFGIYLDGLMFALIADDVLYFKADAINRPVYEDAGMEAFRPFPDKPDFKPMVMPYWQPPTEVWDDEDELCRWARAAFDAALRNRKPKKKAKASHKA